MLDIEEFEDVFHKPGPDENIEDDGDELLEYGAGLRTQIRENQNVLGGRTFFERLLELLQIKWRKIYPPEDEKQLRELHKRIINAPTPLHYKHCLFFYILKDLSLSHHGATELASAFARGVHLEKRFWTFIEGLWCLDHMQFETAVEHLTHPSIIPTFPDEIMLTLLNKQHFGGGGNDVLPLAYYNCAKPPLIKEDVKIEFVKYMAGRNVTETFYWIRARPEYEHKKLLQIFIEETLDRSTWSKSSDEAYTREERTMEFVSLPFDDDEEAFIESFLTEGKGRNYRGAGDTVMMRRIATGRYHEAASDILLKGRKHGQVTWDVLKDGVKRGLGPRKDEESTFAV